jgi:putative hemolysin
MTSKKRDSPTQAKPSSQLVWAAMALMVLISSFLFFEALGMVLDSSANPSGAVTADFKAARFCEDNGGSVDYRTQEDGTVQGVCVFPNKSECDQWAFFHGHCVP